MMVGGARVIGWPLVDARMPRIPLCRYWDGVHHPHLVATDDQASSWGKYLSHGW